MSKLIDDQMKDLEVAYNKKISMEENCNVCKERNANTLHRIGKNKYLNNSVKNTSEFKCSCGIRFFCKILK